MLEMFNILDCSIGGATLPEQVTSLIGNVVNLIQIGIPIILINIPCAFFISSSF